MTTREFLLELLRLDVHLWLEDGRVRCSAPPGALTVERRAELARRRDDIEAMLRAAQVAAPGCVVPIETGDAGGRPFYTVPGHNGDVFCFVPLARRLGAAHPVYGLQPPGLDSASQPLMTIEALAAHFVREVIAQQPEGPYQLGGYCLGGLTAFEMARQLRAVGRNVGALVLFGTMSPPALRAGNWMWASAVEWLTARVRGARAFAAMSNQDRLAKIRRKLLATPEPQNTADGELAARRARLEATTIAAARRYRPEPYDGPVSLFLASEAVKTSLDRPLEWARFARGGLDVFCGPAGCDGDSMLKQATAGVFADQLARRLDKRSAAAPVEVRA